MTICLQKSITDTQQRFGSTIWNNYLHEFENMILSLPLFLHKLENKLARICGEIDFFLANQIAIDHRDINLRTFPSRCYILCASLV